MWRYEEKGAPLDAAIAFTRWIDGLPDDLEQGASVTTARSWPIWRREALSGGLVTVRRELTHWSMTVRYPADDMAYVFAPIVHPDQDEAFMINEPQATYLHVITLLWQGGAWMVHAVGTMVPPADVGRVAYSW